ncbi:MAG: phosphate ABC transporter permease subunit PstC [Bacteroidetes bacterium]|nr:phosphate ABC transporter permease subunit PstC [Bacteroidota bacterium]
MVTTVTVLLIIFFLFKEGFSLFGKSPMEEDFAIYVNNQNPIGSLTAIQVKNISDQEITNWKIVGGKDDTIQTFRIDDLTTFYSEEDLVGIDEKPELITEKISHLLDSVPGLIVFISERQLKGKLDGKKIIMEPVSFANFFLGKEWFPTAQPVAQFGIMPILLGTLWISLVAILIALPFGLATAIYMAEIASSRVRNIMKPIIELLAGIPSVVYGFFGLIVMVPLVQKVFDLPVGESGLTGSLILAIMALPTIITISEDSIRNTPRAMKEASLALGANHWQTIYRVIIPHSMSGITAATILGIGRAIGETMAVLMVTGNAAVMPESILKPMRTIPATIAAELGEAAKSGIHYKALFALGCILFMITMFINLIVEIISRRQKQNQG